jgi:hypothetical protein
VTEQQILGRWRAIAVDLEPATGDTRYWKDEAHPYFLHAFRPDGARLPELFAGLPNTEEVLRRLQVVFHRAGPETGHACFIVSRPRPLTDDEVRREVRSWLRNASQLLRELDDFVDGSLASFDDENLPLTIRTGDAPSQSPRIPPVVTAIHEAVCGFGATLPPHPIRRLLKEPLYGLACSYELAYWVLSPLSEGGRDPLAPAAMLWEAGITLRFEGDETNGRITAWRAPL